MAKLINPALYIIRGVAGSGKSTYAKEVLIPKLKQETGLTEIAHCEADDFFMRKQKDGTYKYCFNPKQLGLAHGSCWDKMKAAFEGSDFHTVVVVSNTFTTVKDMKQYVNYAELNGIELKVIRMNTWYGSVHDVPKDVIQGMREKLAANPFPDEIVIG